jgi:hypothetical protein
MSGTIGVPVETGLFLQLYDFLKECGSDRDPVDVVQTAIEYWMANAEWKANDLMPETAPPQRHRGYFWKPLLLPPGTVVRMTYKKTTHEAKVVGDDFIYLGEKTSPSMFANKVAGGTSRNAWNDLLVRRPHDREFVPADDLRTPTANLDDLPRIFGS